jgi:uncharacterized repeat protein (TIGR01451 family)
VAALLLCAATIGAATIGAATVGATTASAAALAAPASAGALTIDSTVDNTAASLGATLTYTVTVKNSGRIDAANVVAADTLDRAETLVSSTGGGTATGDSSSGPQHVTWTLRRLAPGSQVQFTVLAQVRALPGGGALANEFAVANPPGFADETINHACYGNPGLSCAISTFSQAPGIALHVLVESAPGSGIYIEANPAGGRAGKFPTGDTVQWELQVINTGSVALPDVVVTDEQVPGCARTIASIAPDQQVTYTCTSVAGALGSFTNTATATDDAQSCHVALQLTPAECTQLTSTDTARVDVLPAPPVAHTTPPRRPATLTLPSRPATGLAAAGGSIDTGLGASAGSGVSPAETAGGIALLAGSAGAFVLLARRRKAADHQ